MQRDLTHLRGAAFDLLVIGGGITGAGIALDAGLRGYRTALIERGDLASGTSSASSKLVHGGLRYLEHGDLALVHEALAERRHLLINAPHLVRPLRFLIPFYTGMRRPGWQWRIGLTLYDFLAGRGNLRRSRPLSTAALRRAAPGLRSAGLHGGAAYFDAQMDDARLCLEVAHTAAQAGAVIANYVEAVGFVRSGDRIAGVRVIDRQGSGAFVIHARQVVNAAGPWVDRLCRDAGDPGVPHLRPTQGVHLIVANPAGLTAALLLLHPADGRVFFVIPWPHRPGGAPATLLIGTTDTFADDADAPGVAPADVDYLLTGRNHYFAPALTADDVRGTFVGMRPLLRARADQPSAVSREYRLIESPGGLLSVAGGKYTTYRHMAEVATDAVAARLGQRHPCRTASYRLVGTPEQPWEDYVPRAVADLTRQHALRPEAARHLVERYGQRAFAVARHLDGAPELAQPLTAGEPDLRVEWVYQQEQEMALTPADHLLRRMRVGMWRPELLRDSWSTLRRAPEARRNA